MLVITLVPRVLEHQTIAFSFILGAAQTAILTPFCWSNHTATVQTISYAIICECRLPSCYYCVLVRSLRHESYFKIALRIVAVPFLWH